MCVPRVLCGRVGRRAGAYARGAGFISGGALGNALDRIIHGRVIDFIDFHSYGIHFPTFNFADTFISLGVVTLLFASFKKKD